MTSSYMKDKPFKIDKRQVYKAYKAVKSNQGAAGVDGQTLEQFETDLKKNLFKIWNRMSSGSYFPPPVRAVPIPKKSGSIEFRTCASCRQWRTPSLSKGRFLSTSGSVVPVP